MSRDLDPPREAIDQAAGPSERVGLREAGDLTPHSTARFTDRLDLPRTQERVPVRDRDRLMLRDSESHILARVGAFRVLPESDLEDVARSSHVADDLRHLEREGLIERHRLVINDSPATVVTLTREGKNLLDDRAARSPDEPSQQFYAGVVKPRELAHDAQLYRAFRAEAAQIEREGGSVRRVVLDYELKREYQSFLNRPQRRGAPDIEPDRQTFAAAHRLPIVDGHLELPDLRIEYETPAGDRAYRDVEVVTEHYSRGQIAGKSTAGFSLYRSGGGGSGGRGTPHDPRHLEWLR